MSSFWEGKRVYISGGAGFLGHHVTAELLRVAPDATLIATPRSWELDLRKPSQVFEFINAASPHIVIHLAASCGGIGANQREPGSFAYDNLMMGLNLIEACRMSAPLVKFVNVGTVCSYPKHTPVPFKEESLWDGYPEETNAAYGIAKKAVMEVIRAYRQQHRFPGVTLMLANLYGPHDNFDAETSHVIPAMIRKYYEAKEDEWVSHWGTGTPTREFLYAADAAEAIVLAAERYDSPEPMNIGTGIEISIGELSFQIAGMMNFTGNIRFKCEGPDGQPRRCLNVQRAKDTMGWSAKTSLQCGLDQTVAWFKKNVRHLSNCCFVPFTENTDLCGRCGEHAAVCIDI